MTAVVKNDDSCEKRLSYFASSAAIMSDADESRSRAVHNEAFSGKERQSELGIVKRK